MDGQVKEVKKIVRDPKTKSGCRHFILHQALSIFFGVHAVLNVLIFKAVVACNCRQSVCDLCYLSMSELNLLPRPNNTLK